MELEKLGWRPFFEKHFAAREEGGEIPARIACEHRHYYLAYSALGELEVEAPGKMRREALFRSELPAVGDWVAVEPLPGEERGMVRALLPRQSAFSRLKDGEQIIAANVDVLFLVCGLDGNFNLRRIERYLTLARESGAEPVVVLNKADICADLEARLAAVEEVAGGVPVLALSAERGTGLEALRAHLGPGRTAALTGSSGVGKSTLANALLGAEHLSVQAVRQVDSRGRHTTSHRELLLLPDGGLLIDTPGMRELQLWGDGEGLEEGFADVEARARQCRFADCQHSGEPGCAVQRALGVGELEEGRVHSYLKLKRELEALQRRQQHKERLFEQARRKKEDKRRTRKKDRRQGREQSRWEED